jgi:MFS family permease
MASFVMMALMGSVYTYSVFRYQIEIDFRVQTFSSGLPYMMSLFFYSLSMMISGRLMSSTRIRLFLIVGTLLIAAGWIGASLAQSFGALVFAYGGLIGIGVGMVYGVPIFVIQKRFASNAGFLTGIVLLGFGISPLLTAPLANRLIQSIGLQGTFLTFGILVLGIMLPLSFLFDGNAIPATIASPLPLPVKPAIRPFKKIYLLFIMATTIGLMMIGLSYPIGVAHYGFDASDVTLSLSFFALMNGIARPMFGILMDRRGFRSTVSISLALIFVASVIGFINQGRHLMLYIVSFGLYWFNLGAWLAIVPTMIKEYFGIERYARIYGVMFTAYGIGSILGTTVSGLLLDRLSQTTFLYAFILGLLVVSSVLLHSVPRSDLSNRRRNEASEST